MVKAYIPIDKKQGKTSIRGFWKGSRGLCYNYIIQTRVRQEELSYLKEHYRQECLFYTRKGKAYIWHNENKIEELKRYEYFSYTRQIRGLKSFLQDILNSYGGFTIYIREKDYLVEVWL